MYLRMELDKSTTSSYSLDMDELLENSVHTYDRDRLGMDYLCLRLSFSYMS